MQSLSKSHPLSNLGFDELLALADALCVPSNVSLPIGDDDDDDDDDDALKSHCMEDTLASSPSNQLLGHHHHLSLEQNSIIHGHHNPQPQGTSSTSCCSIATSQIASPILDADNGIRAERRQAEPMQINIKEKDQGKKTNHVSPKKIGNNGTPNSKESQPKRTQKPVSPKPVQSNNYQTGKRVCVRRKISPAVVTLESTIDIVPESAKENAIVHPGIEIAVVTHEMSAGLACELNPFMKQASNCTAFANDKQVLSTSPPKSNPPREKPKQISAAKRKYVRRKGLNKIYTSPTDVTGTGAMMHKFNKMSLKSSLSFESSAGRENLNVLICKENSSAVKKPCVGLAYNQAPSLSTTKSNLPRAKPHTQIPSLFLEKGNPPWTKPKENPTGKTVSFRNGLNKISIPSNSLWTKPKETTSGKSKYFRNGQNKISNQSQMTGELAEPMTRRSTKMSFRRSLNFDKEARENLNVHNSKENRVVVEKKHASLACDLNSLVKQSLLSSTSLSENSPLGAKLKANSVVNKDERKSLATVQNGNISNSQISTIMVGSKRKISDNVKHADNSSINLVGPQYNGFSSYQTKFGVQFPYTKKGKTYNTSNTSVYASSSSCQIHGSRNNAAKVPATSESTERVIDAFNEFIVSLARLTERSRSPTRIRDYASQTNCDKQLGISDLETFENAQKRLQTCIDDLVTETRASLLKKNRSRRKSTDHSHSAFSSRNEMQQHYNFALGNYHLPLGKSAGVSREVKTKTVRDVSALAEEFRQLDINMEARDVAFK